MENSEKGQPPNSILDREINLDYMKAISQAGKMRKEKREVKIGKPFKKISYKSAFSFEGKDTLYSLKKLPYL